MRKKVKLSIYITDPEVIALLREIQKNLSKELCGKKGIPCRLEKGEFVIPLKYLVGIIVKDYVQRRGLSGESREDSILEEASAVLDEIKKELNVDE